MYISTQNGPFQRLTLTNVKKSRLWSRANGHTGVAHSLGDRAGNTGCCKRQVSFAGERRAVCLRPSWGPKTRIHAPWEWTSTCWSSARSCVRSDRRHINARWSAAPASTSLCAVCNTTWSNSSMRRPRWQPLRPRHPPPVARVAPTGRPPPPPMWLSVLPLERPSLSPRRKRLFSLKSKGKLLGFALFTTSIHFFLCLSTFDYGLCCCFQISIEQILPVISLEEWNKKNMALDKPLNFVEPVQEPHVCIFLIYVWNN